MMIALLAVAGCSSTAPPTAALQPAAAEPNPAELFLDCGAATPCTYTDRAGRTWTVTGAELVDFGTGIRTDMVRLHLQNRGPLVVHASRWDQITRN